MARANLSRRVRSTASKLLSWIAENDVAVHDRIPSMSKLSRKFDVSVNTVHSAVRYLSGYGLLDAGVGSGTFLIRPIDEFDLNSEEGTRTVGLVVGASLANSLETPPEILKNERWKRTILRGVYKAGATHKIRIKTVRLPSGMWGNPTAEGLRNAIEPQLKGIDGLISFPVEKHVAVDVLSGLGMPLVLLNPPDDLSTTNYVTPDYYGASVVVGQLAVRLGVKHVWMLTSRPSWPSNRQRIRGLRDGLMFESGRFDGISMAISEGGSYDVGIKAMLDAFGKYPEAPDFIYASGDYLAQAAVDTVRAHRLEPGRDVSIISSTGFPDLVNCDPPMSTVELPMVKTGEAAIEMLKRMLETNQHTLPAKVIPTPVILRGTTPPEAKDILERIEKEHARQPDDAEMLPALM